MWPFGQKKKETPKPVPSKAVSKRISKRRRITVNQVEKLWRSAGGTGTVKVECGTLRDMLDLLLAYELAAPFVAEHGFVASYDKLVETGEWDRINDDHGKNTDSIVSLEELDQMSKAKESLS